MHKSEISLRRGGQRLQSLTSLRFFAAAMIVVDHVRGHFGIPSDIGLGDGFQQGVSFFFILSGFILTYTYPELRLSEVATFLRKRVARIWPAHLATFLLALCLVPWGDLVVGQPNMVMVVLANLALIHAWIPQREFYHSFNYVSWSISTEFGFYLLFPLIIWRLRSSWPLKLAIGCLLLACVATIGNGLADPYDDQGLNLTGLIYVSPLGRVIEFIFGCCLSVWWLHWRERITISSRVATLLEILAVAFVCVSVVGAYGMAMRLMAHVNIGPAGATWLINGGASVPAFGALIFVMALNRGVIARALSLRWPVLLGEISYALYLLHELLLRTVFTAMDSAAVPGWLGCASYCAAILALSYVLWRFVERPLRGVIGGQRPKRAASVIPAAARPALASD